MHEIKNKRVRSVLAINILWLTTQASKGALGWWVVAFKLPARRGLVYVCVCFVDSKGPF